MRLRLGTKGCRAAVATLALTTGLGLAAAPSAASGPPSSAAAGTRIVWTQVVDENFTTARIVSGRSDGTDRHAVSHPAAGEFDLNASISPDGSAVAFERDLADGTTQILVADAGGRHEHVVGLGCADPCAADVDPGWTPDGRRLVFTRVVGPFDQPNDSARSAVLWSVRLDGSGLRRLSEPGIDGVFEDYHARFAPDGSYVTFVRPRNDPLAVAVFRMAPDGSDVRQLTPWRLGGDLADVSPATSGPTKDLVVFETYGMGPPDGKQANVATVPATCHPLGDCVSKIRYVTHHPGTGPVASFNPSWSPDGRRIAFTRFVAAPDGPVGDIWTIRYDGSDANRVSSSTRFEFRSDWGAAG